jgi:NDP-sugar pyrophosphorylase family protein
MRPTRAVILAGGLGMRLRPYTMVLPKPLIPVVDQPIVEHIIRRLAAHGVRRVDLCLGHLGGLIQAYFSRATTLPDDVELIYHWEEEPLGTAGALRTIGEVDGPIVVTNGDILTTLDYAELFRAHVAAGGALTIATREQTVQTSLGVLDCVDGEVLAFREKPTLTYQVSMGIYIYDPRALAALPAEGPCQFPELVVRLLDAGELVTAFPSDAAWYDIGTLGEYERAMTEFVTKPELFAV